MPEKAVAPVEVVWVKTTQTVVPRQGDYVSVSSDNIHQFAAALFAKFEQEVCIALGGYDDDRINALIASAKDGLFPQK